MIKTALTLPTDPYMSAKSLKYTIYVDFTTLLMNIGGKKLTVIGGKTSILNGPEYSLFSLFSVVTSPGRNIRDSRTK